MLVEAFLVRAVVVTRDVQSRRSSSPGGQISTLQCMGCVV